MTQKVKTTRYDTADYLKDDDAVAAYIAEALETGDAAFIVDAIGIAARAKGMTRIAAASGMSRESLYKSLHREGNPEFSTILKVFDAIGLRLAAQPIKATKARKRRADGRVRAASTKRRSKPNRAA